MIDFSKIITVSDKAKAADEQRALEGRQWRDAELARADIQMNKVQDGVTGIGTQKAWREYRIALRNWPSSKAFPEARPVAPDAVI